MGVGDIDIPVCGNEIELAVAVDDDYHPTVIASPQIDVVIFATRKEPLLARQR
jgi:hypothetical protein